MGVINVLFNNVMGFDAIIFFAATVNALLFVTIFIKITSIHGNLNPTQNMSLPVFIPPDLSPIQLQELDSKCKSADSRYSIFIAITSMFSLLGILGTVISLIGLVGGDLTEATQQGFFAALTSTFWGVFFALIYKFLDAFVSTKIQYIKDEIARLKHREGEKQQKELISEEI